SISPPEQDVTTKTRRREAARRETNRKGRRERKARKDRRSVSSRILCVFSLAFFACFVFFAIRHSLRVPSCRRVVVVTSTPTAEREKWQRTTWLGPTGWGGGSRRQQISWASGQRGWKGQPVGMAWRSGTRPGMPEGSARLPVLTLEAIRPRV